MEPYRRYHGLPNRRCLCESDDVRPEIKRMLQQQQLPTHRLEVMSVRRSFLCEPNDMPKVRTNLEKYNYDIVHAEEEHLALQKVTLSDVEYEHLAKFINNVQGLPDVIQVYDNVN